jgi:hypothetical protein
VIFRAPIPFYAEAAYDDGMSEIKEFVIRDEDWATDLQNGLEGYMMALYDSVDEENSEVETESGLPFCGCNVCEAREILTFIVPRAIKGYLDEKVGFEDAPEGFVGKLAKVPSNLKHD